MSLLTWLAEQKLSDWVQGIGSLAAAGAAVGIALRQERLTGRRETAARRLRAQVLAAAILPVLRELHRMVRIRNTLVQSIRRLEKGEEPPGVEDLSIPLPEIFMSTIDRIDVFGAHVAAHVYTLVHRVDEYNRYVRSCREWDVRHLQWEATLQPKLDAIGETLAFLVPHLDTQIDALAAVGVRTR